MKALLCAAVLSACGVARARQARPVQTTLAVGKAFKVPDTSITVTFEDVVEDSRCPTGTNCIWAGDAVIRIGIRSAANSGSSYTLHTNPQFMREVEYEGIRVLLTNLMPHPAEGALPQHDQYVASLSIDRK